MAVTKIKPIKSTLSKALDYIENPDKTDGKMLVSSFGCSYETADIEFEYTLSQALQKGNNLAFHLIQSFEPGEVDYQKAHEIGKQLADAVTKGQHEYVLTTHIDKGHVHNHIIFCAVNFVDHRKYNSNKRSYYGIRNMSDKLCRENGLSVVVPGKGSKGKSYAEYQAEKTGTSWKGKLKIAVDALIPQVSSFEELLQRLQAAGYEIKPGKYVSCRAPGQERFTRLKTLGADYTEEAIRERIAGRRAKAAKAPREQRGVSLLIDIENSIKAAQSKGYEQWAKIHNLKQAAKTMNFLTEHKIEQYADLVSRIEEMAAESGQAADALKDAEKRLADMAVLIKNVSTYQKTKPVYDAYRKARNREKYRAGQEQAIILHEAAARSLKAAGIAKLPNLAALQSEYEALQAQKEALYYQAQKAIRNVAPIQYKTEDDFALKGKICCGNCLRQLRHEKQYGEMVFCCGHKRSVGKFSHCYSGYYREQAVNSRVARAIKTVFTALEVVNQGMQEKKSITLQCVDVDDLKKQAEMIRAEQIKLYESYADGILTRNEYLEKKKGLGEKLADLQEKIRIEEEEQETADELDEEIRSLTKQASQKTYIGGLTKECVDAFVSMVYLYDDQTMKVEFNCEDVIRRALEKYGA